ncbi:MAG: class I SAM-dependent methyltransferase [Micavibrio sp.]|nr:class I SAM-dependent methyltransferase [Micavibrio sp.]
MGWFGRKSDSSGKNQGNQRTIRSSRGWGETLTFLKDREGLRVLDFGATSPGNINYLTELGHSFYMANVVEEATKQDWFSSGEDGKQAFDAERFAAANFDFAGREFDAVLLWDTADYLPPPLVPILFSKLREALHPGGRLLAFSHGKQAGPETQFSRYHITDRSEVELQPVGDFPVQGVYQTRQIEGFLNGYSDVRFYLGKDNTREIIAVR